MTEDPLNYPPPNYPPPTYPPPYLPPPTPGGYGYSAPPTPGGYGGYGYPAPPPVYGAMGPKTNALAIASLVTSVIGLVTCGVGNIVGLVLGFVALSQIKRTGDGGRGMAIAGIVISGLTFAFLVVALIIGLVAKPKHTDSDVHTDTYNSERASVVTTADATQQRVVVVYCA